MEYQNRKFVIFSTSEIMRVDFSQVLETSKDTLRKSVNGEKTFVKWDGEEMPTCVQSIVTKEGPYTYEDMISIMATPEWTDPNGMA